MRILFIHQNLKIGGGAEVLRKYVIPYLSKEKFKADICCIQKKGIIGEEIESLGYRIMVLSRKINIFNSFFILWDLYRIRRKRYDVIHSSLFYANLFGRLAGILAGTRILIIEEHGIYKWKNKYPFFIWIDRFLARFTYRIICCSESVRDFTIAQEKIPKEKFMVMRNCVDFNSLDILDTKDTIRKRYSFNAGEILIGIVGMIKEEKGHLYLIDALNILNKKYKNLRLLIVGDGLLYGTVKRYVDNLGINGAVLFLGWRQDIPHLLRAMLSSKEYLRRWSDLIKKVYEVDPLICPKCGGKMNIVAFVKGQLVINRILTHKGLPQACSHSPPEEKKAPAELVRVACYD